jgi:predicted nuclease of restriction endonuclease-like RecB superfamily
MANFLPALPLCDRWEMEADILDHESGSSRPTLSFELDQTDNLSSHYSAQGDFNSDVERTLAQKWERSNTDWELVREDDVLDLCAEIMLPDFAIEHPDGRRVVFEIVGFWTPEYLDEKLAKIREAERDNLIIAVSERLDCSSEDFAGMDDRVLWFKSGIHVYDVVELAEEYAIEVSASQ